MRLMILMTLALVSLTSSALGHGMSINISADENGKLRSQRHVWWGAEATFAPAVVAAENVLRWQGGITVPTPDSGIADGTVLNFDAAGDPLAIGPDYAGQALLFWNGAAITPTDEVHTLRRGASSIFVDQDDTFVPGLAVGAYNAAQLGWHGTLNFILPTDAPLGLYAVGLRVTSPDYDDTGTFWVVGNNGLSAEDYARGVAAITAVVPEPSSLALAALGVALVGFTTYRRCSH